VVLDVLYYERKSGDIGFIEYESGRSVPRRGKSKGLVRSARSVPKRWEWSQQLIKETKAGGEETERRVMGVSPLNAAPSPRILASPQTAFAMGS